MRKIFVRTVALICCVTMIFSFGCNCSCNDNPNNDDGNFKNTSTVLAENATTDYVIVIPENASECEKTAANLLADEFECSTSAKLSVVSDSGRSFDENQKVISIGRTTILKGSGVEVTTKELTYEGYKVKTQGNTVLLCGAEDSGTLYGVSDFLREHFAYEVYAVDEIYREVSTDKIYLKALDITEIPDFWGRNTDGYFGKSVKLASSMRLRSAILTESYGYGSSRDWLPGDCHTLKKFIPEAKYKAKHPEWFYDTQICLTNKELIAEFKKNLKEMILENPDAKIINISEEDFGSNLGMCCDTCKAEVIAYGRSGYLIRFVNNVIKDIEQWLVDEGIDREFYYTCFAYTSSGTIVPPVTEQSDGTYTVKDESCIPHEKLYIRLAPLDPVCYSHSFTDETCSASNKIATYVKGWQSITDRFFVWDYDCSYRNYFVFFNGWDALQENLQFYKSIGVTNIFRQSTTGSTVRSFGALNGYLTAKLMWDVNSDTATLINEFFNNYYKSGADYMKQCFDLLRSHCNMMDSQKTNGMHFQCYDEVSASDWPITVLETALNLINKAIETYDNLKTSDSDLYDKLYQRVLSESVCLRWMILQNYSSYYNITSKAYTLMIDQWEKDAALVGATTYAESKNTSDWIKTIRQKAN